MRLPVSVFIIAKNEADRIAITIQSVIGWADEVVVIDSGSSDDTVALSQSLGARVVFNAWPGYGMQKRFGEEQCKNHWLFNIDADEEVTLELAQEIQALFAGGEPKFAGYWVDVKDLLPGEKNLSRFAHNNPCLRLYNRECGRFSDSPVHDSVIMQKGEAGQLKAPVLHRSFRSFAHAVEKMNAYTNVQAEHLKKRGLSYPQARLVWEFPFSFIKHFFLRGYCTRGWRGFVFSIIYASGRVIRIAKYLERQP